MPSAGLQQCKNVLVRVALLAGIWAGLVGLLIAAGDVVTGSASLTHFDHHGTSVVVSWRTPALNFVMKAVTWLGSWVALLVTAVIIVLLVITRRLPVLAAVVAVFAWAGEAGGVGIGKEVIRRDRPPQAIWLVGAHGWSFPSGHAAVACLTFTVLAGCVAALARRQAVRIAGWLAAGLAVAATAFSRVELGVHWMTDVIASVVFVACWLTAIVISLGGRLRRPEPIADHIDGPKPVPRRDETQLDLVRRRHASPAWPPWDGHPRCPRATVVSIRPPTLDPLGVQPLRQGGLAEVRSVMAQKSSPVTTWCSRSHAGVPGSVLAALYLPDVGVAHGHLSVTGSIIVQMMAGLYMLSRDRRRAGSPQAGAWPERPRSPFLHPRRMVVDLVVTVRTHMLGAWLISW